MITNLLPIEATHSSLDIFEKAALLVTFDSSFEQKVGTSYAADGPTLDFEVVGDRNNFIDLQKIYLEVKFKILNSNGTDLRYDAGTPANTDAPFLVNNILHSLWSDCNVTANGIKISSANGTYGHKSFIETEFSHGKEAKDTWLKCQGYDYEADPGNVTTPVFAARERSTRTSNVVTVIGKVAADFFNCDKHLLNGVTLRISFLRARPDFCLISEEDAKHYKIVVTEANLYCRKMTVADHVVSAIEKVLSKTPATYRYTEVLPKVFLMTRGILSWSQEDVFNKEPVRRFAIAMCLNNAFVGSNRSNPYHYQKYDLQQITVYRNGMPVAGTPLHTVDNKRMYFNSLSALAYFNGSHGIPLNEFENHYVMVFDLTSTQQASHEFIHPELTNSSISLQLQFRTALPDNVELFLLGEKASTIYIDSARNVSKNVLMST